MFIKVNGKNLVFGMEWHVMISDGSVVKAVKKAKSTYYWNSGSAFYYGAIPRNEKVVKKDLPLYSAVIAFATAQSEGNLLAVMSIPGTSLYAICGIYQGRPREGFDAIATSVEEVSDFITRFNEICADAGYTLMGDIQYDDLVPFTLAQLADAATDYAQIKKVKSELINPVTITLAIAALAFAGKMGWDEYVKYRNQEIARQIAASQKSAQQMYDDALNRRRQESGMLASDSVKLMDAFLKMPPAIGGWNLQKATCKPTPEKLMRCVVRYARGSAIPIDNKTFLSESKSQNFKSIAYKPDLKSIEAVIDFAGLPFTTIGVALDAAVTQKEESLEFGAQLQKLLPFGSPSVSAYAPIVLPVTVDQSKLSKPSPTFARWKPTGPVRIMELCTTFPKYAMVEEFTFTVGKTPRYRFNESFATVELNGVVYAKPN